MEHFEQDLERRFHNEQLPNAGFDTEGLWQSIEANMEQSPAVAWWKRKGIWSLALVLLMAGSAGFWLVPESTESPTNRQVLTHAADNTSDAVVADTYRTVEALSTNNQSETAPSIAAPNQVTHATEGVESAPISRRSHRAALQTSISREAASVDLNPSGAAENSNDALDSGGRSNQGHDKSRQGSTVDSRKTKSEQRQFSPRRTPRGEYASSIQLLAPHGIGRLPIDYTPAVVHLLKDTFDIDSLIFSEPRRSNWAIALGALGGMNYTGVRFRTDGPPLSRGLNTTIEQSYWGESFGLNAQLLYKSKIGVTMGLEQHEVYTRFDHEQTRASLVLKEDQLLKVVLDPATADTLHRFYGDTLVTSTTTRKIQNYNHYRLLSIPVLLTYQKEFGRFRAGVSGGLVLNIFREQHGFWFDEDNELTPFDLGQDAQPFPKAQVGMRIGPHVGYQLTRDWSIALNPSFSWLQSGFLGVSRDLPVFQQHNLNAVLHWHF